MAETHSSKSAATQLPEEYRKMIEKAERVSPGIHDLMQAYGRYEESVQTARNYLQMTKPIPSVSLSNNSR